MREAVNSCPACGGEGVNLVTTKDYVFFSSDDSWVYFRCVRCSSVYLSERPKLEFIYRAYSAYYTHSERRGFFARCVKSLVSLYVSRSFAGAVFRVVARLIYPVACFFDARSRSIRFLRRGRLFDYGCGNGEFLSLCGVAGIDADGVDLDSKAIRHASSLGLKVRQGGCEVLKDIPSETYDWVTVSHVVEHVYDLNRLLVEFNRILKPGGKLWIETPNGRAAGLDEFAQFWRGLEPPRHLVLFSRRALLGKLNEHDFEVVLERYHFLSGLLLYMSSLAIMKRAGFNGFGQAGMYVLSGFWRDLSSFFNRDRAELITLLCRKK